MGRRAENRPIARIPEAARDVQRSGARCDQGLRTADEHDELLQGNGSAGVHHMGQVQRQVRRISIALR